MHILSFLLCTLAVATSNENPPYKFYCPTVGECSLVDVSKYHLYGEVSLTEYGIKSVFHNNSIIMITKSI